jgi:hypothetical protein
MHWNIERSCMSGNTERDETGKFESELGNKDIMSYFAEGRPFHTAQEISDRFGIDRSTAYRRLSQLEDDGRLNKVSLGSRTVIWWYTPETATVPNEIESDDPLFSAPKFSVDDPIDDNQIDDVLYGEIKG